MNTHLIAEICAGIAVAATVVYIIIGFKGIKLLRDIRDQARNKPHS